jgi:plastocyanin
MPKGNENPGSIQATPTPGPTQGVTASATLTVTPVSQVTYTGKDITVKLDRDRGFYAPDQSDLKIKAGDGVIWVNDGTYPLTLISKDGLFDDKRLDNDKRTTYIFKNTGTFTFDILGVKKFSGTVTVEP